MRKESKASKNGKEDEYDLLKTQSGLERTQSKFHKLWMSIK